MRRPYLAPLACVVLAACIASPHWDHEERAVRAYYEKEIVQAFAEEDVQALAALFDPAITRPMTHAQITQWSKDFFGNFDGIRFHVDALAIEEIESDRAVALLTYHVTTAGGKGDFGGTERDILMKKDGRWLTAAWSKLRER